LLRLNIMQKPKAKALAYFSINTSLIQRHLLPRIDSRFHLFLGLILLLSPFSSHSYPDVRIWNLTDHDFTGAITYLGCQPQNVTVPAMQPTPTAIKTSKGKLIPKGTGRPGVKVTDRPGLAGWCLLQVIRGKLVQSMQPRLQRTTPYARKHAYNSVVAGATNEHLEPLADQLSQQAMIEKTTKTSITTKLRQNIEKAPPQQTFNSQVESYESSGTGYSDFYIVPWLGRSKIFSANELNTVSSGAGKSPGFWFLNLTNYPVAYHVSPFVGFDECGDHGVIEPRTENNKTGSFWHKVIDIPSPNAGYRDLRFQISPTGKDPAGTDLEATSKCIEAFATETAELALAAVLSIVSDGLLSGVGFLLEGASEVAIDTTIGVSETAVGVSEESTATGVSEAATEPTRISVATRKALSSMQQNLQSKYWWADFTAGEGISKTTEDWGSGSSTLVSALEIIYGAKGGSEWLEKKLSTLSKLATTVPKGATETHLKKILTNALTNRVTRNKLLRWARNKLKDRAISKGAGIGSGVTADQIQGYLKNAITNKDDQAEVLKLAGLEVDGGSFITHFDAGVGFEPVKMVNQYTGYMYPQCKVMPTYIITGGPKYFEKEVNGELTYWLQSQPLVVFKSNSCGNDMTRDPTVATSGVYEQFYVEDGKDPTWNVSYVLTMQCGPRLARASRQKRRGRRIEVEEWKGRVPLIKKKYFKGGDYSTFLTGLPVKRSGREKYVDAFINVNFYHHQTLVGSRSVYMPSCFNDPNSPISVELPLSEKQLEMLGSRGLTHAILDNSSALAVQLDYIIITLKAVPKWTDLPQFKKVQPNFTKVFPVMVNGRPGGAQYCLQGFGDRPPVPFPKGGFNDDDAFQSTPWDQCVNQMRIALPNELNTGGNPTVERKMSEAAWLARKNVYAAQDGKVADKIRPFSIVVPFNGQALPIEEGKKYFARSLQECVAAGYTHGFNFVAFKPGVLPTTGVPLCQAYKTISTKWRRGETTKVLFYALNASALKLYNAVKR
jgi:hypothetical protein